MPRSPVAVHVSPHPDDESIGAPVTLQMLRRHGWRVMDINVSKGRPADHDVRTEEWHEALRRAGIEGMSLDPSVPTSGNDDLVAAERRIATELTALFDQLQPRIVISPHGQDVDHGHEVVARGVRTAIAGQTRPPAWWCWGLWAELSAPNLVIPFDQSDLDQAKFALRAHTSQLERLDFTRLVEGNAMARAVRGTELVFGTGAAPVSKLPYAELLTEVTFDGAGWQWSQGRLVDFSNPLATAIGVDASPVLDRPSVLPGLTRELR